MDAWCVWVLKMPVVFHMIIICLLHLQQYGTHDYDREWPIEGNWSDMLDNKSYKCAQACGNPYAIVNLTRMDASEFSREKYDELCPADMQWTKCRLSCFKKGRPLNLSKRIAAIITFECSEDYLKHLSCLKAVHKEKKVSDCIDQCTDYQWPASGLEVEQDIGPLCKQIECQSKCQKEELLLQCKKEGKEAFAKNIKNYIAAFKLLAWAIYHRGTGKRLNFTDNCDQIVY